MQQRTTRRQGRDAGSVFAARLSAQLDHALGADLKGQLTFQELERRALALRDACKAIQSWETDWRQTSEAKTLLHTPLNTAAVWIGDPPEGGSQTEAAVREEAIRARVSHLDQSRWDFFEPRQEQFHHAFEVLRRAWVAIRPTRSSEWATDESVLSLNSAGRPKREPVAPTSEPVVKTSTASEVAAPAPASEAAGQAIDDKPKRLLAGWHEIAAALDMNYRDRGKIKSLNDRFQGPITNQGSGTQPIVYQDKLVEWWNKLAVLAAESANRRKGALASAEAQYDFGRDGTAAPEIGGGIKKRRRRTKSS
jgi:hypothetical protein